MIKGMELTNDNIHLVIDQFVSALNSQDMDCAMTCSYDKIREFQLTKEKEVISDCLRGKIDNLKKLLPVKQEHIRYLTEELNKMASELIQ